jgi:hypothetical protein
MDSTSACATKKRTRVVPNSCDRTVFCIRLGGPSLPAWNGWKLCQKKSRSNMLDTWRAAPPRHFRTHVRWCGSSIYWCCWGTKERGGRVRPAWGELQKPTDLGVAFFFLPSSFHHPHRIPATHRPTACSPTRFVITLHKHQHYPSTTATPIFFSLNGTR